MGNITVKASAEEISKLLGEIFPQAHGTTPCFFIEEVSPGKAIMRFEPDERHLRPGGTVSGPSLFSLADYTAYVAIMGAIGLEALAVTTNLNINFMRKPEPRTILCEATIMKLGRSLCVMDLGIRMADGADSGDLIAHATTTYSIPPRKE
jgi:uncharacterized protein (TIGR00369 family)